MKSKKRIGIIGATGSIGTQAIDVIMSHNDIFSLEFITAHKNIKLLDTLKEKTGVTRAFSTDTADAMDILEENLDKLDIDIVLHAASGINGIRSAYMIIDKGIDIAIANKESLVTAGNIIINRAEETGSNIIPVDSEHSAIFQLLIGHKQEHIESITLTASGGPFINRPTDAMTYISLSEALKHPKWTMGQKISIDSATMMNKGLELIEAKYLFNIPAEKLNVIIHPESIVHSFVNFIDGSTTAQLGYPDMRIPISFALSYPNRVTNQNRSLRLADIKKLTFIKPDFKRFKALDIAMQILKNGSNRDMIMLNSSNEAAVMAFIRGDISFTDIIKVVETSLESINFVDATNIDEAIEFSQLAYRRAESTISKLKR